MLLFRCGRNFIQEDKRTAQEAAEKDAAINEAGLAEIKEEQELQATAAVNDADPMKEAARIRDRHARSVVSGDNSVYLLI